MTGDVLRFPICRLDTDLERFRWLQRCAQMDHRDSLLPRVCRSVQGLFADEAPAVEDPDAGADALRFGEQVAVQHDSASGGTLFGDHSPNERSSQRVEPIGRLVKHQQIRLAEQSESDERALLFSLGEPMRRAVQEVLHPEAQEMSFALF